MDQSELGRRIAAARDDADVTQEGLARLVGLDRTAITKLESGARKLNVAELVRISAALERPLSYFVSDVEPAVISRRTDLAGAHDSTKALDAELQLLAADLRSLLELGILAAPPPRIKNRIPRSHGDAETTASKLRSHLGLASAPIDDLGATSEKLGLYTFAAPLGPAGPDGGCVEVDTPAGVIGAAVLNGDAPAGRRRMTLAHELGHWVFGDAYDSSASADAERMIGSFAIHFLAPREGVTKTWNDYPSSSVRGRALAVSAIFRLSWTAAIGQLRNINLITFDDFEYLKRTSPREGDFAQIGLRWTDELNAPYLSPVLTQCILGGFAGARLTRSRSLELLRSTLLDQELPQRVGRLEDWEKSFQGHDD